MRKNQRPFHWYYGTIDQADNEAEKVGPNLVTVTKSKINDLWLIEIW